VAKKISGLTSFDLKVIGLVTMTMDHIDYILGAVLPVPSWFRLVGRIAAPLFMFLSSEAVRHTHSRGKYLLRLWLGYLAMALILDKILYRYPLNYSFQLLIDNMFGTLFLSAWFTIGVEHLLQGFRRRSGRDIAAGAAMCLVPWILHFLKYSVFTSSTQFAALRSLLFYTCPDPLTTDYGWLFLVMGVGFYFTSRWKGILAIFYIFICAVFWFSGDYWQTYMILALPFLLLYNGRRGRRTGLFFYFYYPLHLYFLLWLLYQIR
jgi:hypothetical protein